MRRPRPFLAALSLAGCFAAPGPGGAAESAVDPVESYNYVIGTQTFSAAYQFTDEHWLVETAKRIQEMGSNAIKFRLGWKPEHHPPELSPPAASMADLARRDPAIQAVLEMPFYYYFLWTTPLAPPEPGTFNPVNKQANYREIYDLTKYLLETYNGTGKTFYLGNWEGDHLFTKMKSKDRNYRPTEQETREAIEWANNRQKAVDDAKAATPHQDVDVYYYVEVNKVRDAIANSVRLTNAVLPQAPVDYVSYSAYDAIYDQKMETLRKSLSYIEAKLPPRAGLEGKRVFIGEFGYPAKTFDPKKQAEWTKKVLRAGLEWGCPFILYWEMYNNEVKDGKQVGYWLITDKNEKTPTYFLYENFYKQARKFVGEFHAREGRVPTPDEYRQAALQWLP